MKVAVISNPRHTNGDLIEFMLLRAAHWFGEYEKADLMLVTGELTPWNTSAARSFLSEFFSSLKLRKLAMPVVWLTDRPRWVELPEPPAMVTVDAVELPPAELVERIRRSAGKLPDFSGPAFETVLAETGGDGSIRSRRVAMALPELPCITDFHVHTNLAYCSENMNIPQALEMARLTRLAGLCFSEHSGHLYLDIPDYWEGRCVWRNVGTPCGFRRLHRMEGYCEALASAPAGAWLNGFEIDVDAAGDIMLLEEDRPRARVLLGAVHFLDERRELERAKREFLFRTEALLKYGVQILAHPFRIFAWAGLPKPPELYRPVIELLKRYDVAAEINFHCNEPETEFFDLCVRSGVKLSLGSDAHNLYEVGFLHPHLRFLDALGLSGRLDSILWQYSGK